MNAGSVLIIPCKTLRRLVVLPRRVKMEWSGAAPQQDEYGNALPVSELRALQKRATSRASLQVASRVLTDSKLAPFYRQSAIVPYLWYPPQRGHYSFGVELPRLEAHCVWDEKKRPIVVLINHTCEKLRCRPMCFFRGKAPGRMSWTSRTLRRNFPHEYSRRWKSDSCATNES